MKCLDKFRAKMNYSGGSLRNENIENSKALLRETFSDDASFEVGIYFWSLGDDKNISYKDRDPIKIRFYSKTYSSANGVTVKFQTLYDTPINVGDIVYDSCADNYLICTESFLISNVHWEGKFTLCNWVLKWQNRNGEILEYPCYDMNTTQYNSGEQSSQLMTIGSTQHTVLLPCDENTVILNTPQRFFLDKNTKNPTCYIVTQNDTTTYNYGKKGLVRIMLYECAMDEKLDRPDLGICNYIENNKLQQDDFSVEPVPKPVISYETNIIKSGGDKQCFYGNIYDENGNEIDDISLKWNIICSFRDFLNIEEIDNRIYIGIDNDNYIDEEFKLVLSDIREQYYSSIIIKVESLL